MYNSGCCVIAELQSLIKAVQAFCYSQPPRPHRNVVLTRYTVKRRWKGGRDYIQLFMMYDWYSDALDNFRVPEGVLSMIVGSAGRQLKLLS